MTQVLECTSGVAPDMPEIGAPGEGEEPAVELDQLVVGKRGARNIAPLEQGVPQGTVARERLRTQLDGLTCHAGAVLEAMLGIEREGERDQSIIGLRGPRQRLTQDGLGPQSLAIVPADARLPKVGRAELDPRDVVIGIALQASLPERDLSIQLSGTCRQHTDRRKGGKEHANREAWSHLSRVGVPSPERRCGRRAGCSPEMGVSSAPESPPKDGAAVRRTGSRRGTERRLPRARRS